MLLVFITKELLVFYKKTKRQKNFQNILKYTSKKFYCDKIFEKVQGRYEFNVYHNIKKDVEDYLSNYNIQVISVSDENGDFCVVREVKGELK